MNEELKPCPFCGGTKIKIELEGWYYRAVCMNLCGMVGGRYLTKEQATAGWNIRPLEYDLRFRAERAEAERDAARAEAGRLREALTEARDFHPRAMKLIYKQKNFVVVAEDEPYFMDVYRKIRANERKKGRWTFEDEQQYKSARLRATALSPAAQDKTE